MEGSITAVRSAVLRLLGYQLELILMMSRYKFLGHFAIPFRIDPLEG
jgi:hypothetical protein